MATQVQVQEKPTAYAARKWQLSGLDGISDHTLEVHFGLYEGYVKNTNLLREQIAEFRARGIASGADPKFAELVRRCGFEYNGMRLHELYFDNLTKKPGKVLDGGRFHQAVRGAFGDIEAWRKEFTAVGGMRGVGWAILYQDPKTGELSNHWITLHEVGNVAGFKPIIVMDVWEHAFMYDYKPADRAKYMEAFFRHVDWDRCEERVRETAPAF
jgi:superoxide dismutase, Fe-Mn family